MDKKKNFNKKKKKYKNDNFSYHFMIFFIKTNRQYKGQASTDRNNKATLLFTAPCTDLSRLQMILLPQNSVMKQDEFAKEKNILYETQPII